MESFIVDLENDVSFQGKLWLWMSVSVMLLAFTIFAYLSWQIVPLLGAKGLYPAVKKQAAMRNTFSLRRRMLHFPSSWFGIIGPGYGDAALRFYPVYGMAITGGFIASELLAPKPFAVEVSRSYGSSQFMWFPVQVILLWFTWFLHACTSDLVTMPFPWHSLMNEALFLLALSYTTMLDTAVAPATYPTIGIAAFRMLTFRVLFGFGKFKFQGAKLRDWKYIKGFLPSIPVPSPFGPLAYRYLPDAAYGLAYLFFFLSEIIAPFLYFAPWAWWRVVAAIFTAKLMFGILISGNFGNFNLIVIALCIAVPLPVTGAPRNPTLVSSVEAPWRYAAAASVAYWALVLHMVAGVLVLPFNTWVQSSWFGWPALLHAAPAVKKFCAVFEVMQEWRVLQPYGIFPPNSFAAQRQMSQFEGSRDGIKWTAYQLRHQPTEPGRRPSFLPGIHPWLDFILFYQLGFYGFMQSCTYLTGCLVNFECRPIDAVARNLLEGGDGADLFGYCPFSKSNPPTYIRVVQIHLRPETSGPNWWKVSRGQLELPITSLSTMDTLIPKIFVTDLLVDTEPGQWMWRDRVRERLDQLNKFMPEGKQDQKALAVLRHLASEQKKLSSECVQFIQAIAKGCNSLEDVLRYSEKERHYIEVPALRHGIHKLALLVADVLVTCGWPWTGENKPRMAKLRKDGDLKAAEPDFLPVSMVQLYCFCLYLLANPQHFHGLHSVSSPEDQVEILKKLLLRQVEGPFRWYQVETPLEKEQVHDGIRLFVALFPRTMRLEASVCRRWIHLGLVNVARQEEREPDLVLPGFQAYWRSLFQKGVPFFTPSDPTLAQSCPNGSGGCWGKESISKFTWSRKKSEFEFVEICDGVPSSK